MVFHQPVKDHRLFGVAWPTKVIMPDLGPQDEIDYVSLNELEVGQFYSLPAEAPTGYFPYGVVVKNFPGLGFLLMSYFSCIIFYSILLPLDLYCFWLVFFLSPFLLCSVYSSGGHGTSKEKGIGFEGPGKEGIPEATAEETRNNKAKNSRYGQHQAPPSSPPNCTMKTVSSDETADMQEYLISGKCPRGAKVGRHRSSSHLGGFGLRTPLSSEPRRLLDVWRSFLSNI